jgi:hypothetical protein
MRVGWCLNVDAVKLIEATPGTARGQSFEELSHLGKRVNHQKNVRFKGERMVLMEEIMLTMTNEI